MRRRRAVEGGHQKGAGMMRTPVKTCPSHGNLRTGLREDPCMNRDTGSDFDPAPGACLRVRSGLRPRRDRVGSAGLPRAPERGRGDAGMRRRPRLLSERAAPRRSPGRLLGVLS
eukprot:scaffold396_cov339-Prasinococcus_capsulatus_cf.AAC.7